MADPAIPIAYGVPLQSATAPSSSSFDGHTQNNNSRLSMLEKTRSQRMLTLSSSQQQLQQPLSASAVNALREQGYTKGLVDALHVNGNAFPLSIWVVDNSGSMARDDGHRIVEMKKGQLKFVKCTRWKEMEQTVDYHAQMAALLQKPTVFRMLNDPGRVAGPQQFGVADKGISMLDHDLAVSKSVMMNSQPSGVTPLTEHIREIYQNILALEPELRQNGTKVTIVLATDGLPTTSDGHSNFTAKQQFVDTLRSLEGLPVWVVVRLCTDEDDVVEYWNDLDSQLELSVEVLDDFCAEAEEVYEFNKWLTYGLPLHRMRELGFHHRIFDFLDERKLSKDELSDFCSILFGRGSMDEAPDPEVDWKGFCGRVKLALANEQQVWNPRTKRLEPWIDMKRLRKEYGSSNFLGVF